ncbi:MAG: hypothetical protein JXB15_10335 [Anaerolineales bacterium]|nr:hypothetical protein [Anaerolineales bacterium]
MIKYEDEIPEDSSKQKVYKVLDEAENQWMGVITIAREFAQRGQSGIDFIQAVRQAIPYMPRETNWEPLVESWVNWTNDTEHAISSARALFIPIASSSGSAMFNTTSVINENVISCIPAEKVNDAQEAIRGITQVLSRSGLKDDVLNLLVQFGFDLAQPGNKSPQEELEIAYAAFERPVLDSNPVVTSLIPIRECINMIVAELLRRRPEQEGASNQRLQIISIGRQLASSEVDEVQIKSLADQYHELTDDLSKAKKSDISRSEWERQLQRATLFLFNLLSIIDPPKLRKIKGSR